MEKQELANKPGTGKKGHLLHEKSIPKNTSNLRRHDDNPLENVSCRIGDGICAAKHVSVIQRTRLFHPMNESQKVQSILRLQRQYGNQFTQRIINQHAIQPKLKIGQPDDKYEQEADRVADAVMRMPEPKYQRRPETQGRISRVQEQSSQTPVVNPGVETHLRSLNGGGQPLPKSVRDFFEPRFGYDFSQVRVHTDSKAANSARVVNARAFTAENNIVFGSGQYTPDTSEGRRLLGHELSHVVQQEGHSRVVISRKEEVAAKLVDLTDNEGVAAKVATSNKFGPEAEQSLVAELVWSAAAAQKKTKKLKELKEPKICGPDITGVIISHLNMFLSQPQRNLNPIWIIGAFFQLRPYARDNSRRIRAALDRVAGCPSHGDCYGTCTIAGKCISSHHIDHILMMAYMEASYGSILSRRAGQYQESMLMGLLERGVKFEGSSDARANADLVLNEIGLCLAENMAHAEETNGKSDELTELEVAECFKGVESKIIGKKRAWGTLATRYTNCKACRVRAPKIVLDLPPIDL